MWWWIRLGSWRRHSSRYFHRGDTEAQRIPVGKLEALRLPQGGPSKAFGGRLTSLRMTFGRKFQQVMLPGHLSMPTLAHRTREGGDGSPCCGVPIRLSLGDWHLVR